MARAYFPTSHLCRSTQPLRTFEIEGHLQTCHLVPLLISLGANLPLARFQIAVGGSPDAVSVLTLVA
jgi:hypothetical protein